MQPLTICDFVSELNRCIEQFKNEPYNEDLRHHIIIRKELILQNFALGFN